MAQENQQAKAREVRQGPEVVARAERRTFTAEYKERILREASQCKPGELGALLRREGLYRSHLNKWRAAQKAGGKAALAVKKVGRKPKDRNPLEDQVRQLEREKAQLERRLKQAETIIEVQKKISSLLQIPLSDENT